MKREYVRPTAVCENFTANEYVAACYQIYCETPKNNSTFYSVYYDGSRNPVYSSWNGFTGCGRYHKGVVQDEPPVANGYVKDRNGNATPVFVWEEKLGGNTVDVHVMNPNGKGYVDISSPQHPNASM